MQNVSIIGADLNGLITAAVLNPELNIVIRDFDNSKITLLKDKQLLIDEPKLYEELFDTFKSIEFQELTDDASWIVDTDIVISFLKPVELESLVAKLVEIKPTIKLIVAGKVPINTCDNLVSQYGIQVMYLTNNWLQGTMLKDANIQRNIIVGRSTTIKQDDVLELMQYLFGYETADRKYQIVSNRTAILSKLAHDTYLALHIGYANELNQLCHAVDVDYMQLKDLMALDCRIHPTYMVPCPGYGGIGLIESTKLLSSQYTELVTKWMPRTSKPRGVLSALVDSNQSATGCAYTWISDILAKYPEAKSIGILGITFKENSKDLTESRYLDIAKALESEILLSNDFTDIYVYDDAFDRNIFTGYAMLVLESSLEQVIQKSDILIVNHSKYANKIQDTVAKVIIDFSGAVKPETRKELYSWIA